MTVTFGTQVYECSRAVKNGENGILYLADGGTVEFRGISDWDVFALEGGSWELPGVTAEEQMRADIDYLAAMTGVEL